MGKWTVQKLSDIATLVMGQSPTGETCNTVGVGYPLLNGPTEFGSYSPTPTQYTTSPSKFAQPGDLLFCVRGSTTGKMNWADREYAIGRGLAAIRHKGGLVYQPLLRKIIENNLKTILAQATGSTFPNVSRQQLLDLEVAMPPAHEQLTIANAIANLDAKVELNHKQNQTLEQLAQTLFRQWFVAFDFPVEAADATSPKLDNNPTLRLPPPPVKNVTFTSSAGYRSSGGEMVESELGLIPKGWRVGSIYSVAKVIYGASFASKLFNEKAEGLPLIRIRDLKTFSPSFYTTETHSKSTLITAGNLLVGMDAEFTPTVWMGDDGLMNQRVCMFRPASSEVHELFILHSIKPLLEFFERAKVGTTVIHLGKSDIDTFKLIVPPTNALQSFQRIAAPIFQKLLNNAVQSRTLATLRDTLLPQLLSGRLTVRQAEELVAQE
ncbi:restriction endonuclease subunit S [Hymenobacter gummosus]|uniref:Restriction endonuclease subunit S n=1 Tax=Hymenobacter gummosus TaxID=1776032 RepID=A0A3S0H2V6_9BACT|nr:restriction endonuclease subunit S [Hymenobacter gummosus]RTQ47201.1 restriction endonuclease subunit S [Hymenobacter gummosus]